ncbi:MAG: phosphoribosylaminoimidazolesuccinocarboxamide synthase, partial [Candidatus Dormibacteraceae bacterium]
MNESAPPTESGEFNPPILDPQAPGLPLAHRGKVRNIYAVGADRLLLVASDRLSAFDSVLPSGVPDKGRILSRLAAFWFEQTEQLMPNHLISASWPEISRTVGLDPGLRDLAGRSMLVKRAERIDVECVMRGYLAGSGWAEYRAHGTLAGVPLPPGLRQGDPLPIPAFTPALKNDEGHDENVTTERLAARIGADLADRLERASRDLYTFAARYARTRGIILADTKFEFGLVDGSLMLIDEALTPDSSRFWDAATHQPGTAPTSFDKQPIRDYLSSLGWRGEGPAPALPRAVIAETVERYR